MPSDRTERLKTWLNQQLSTLPAGAPLPTDRQLAERFDVSGITVTRVVREFKLAGRIERIPGRGSFVPKSEISKTDNEPSAPRSAPESLADTIYQAICRGEIRHGESLPPVKLLCLQFNVATQTVTSAYRILEKRGIARKIGKAYWVGQFTALIKTGRTRDIYLFRSKSKDFKPVFQTDAYAFAYQKMERELFGHGFTLRFESTDNLPWLLNNWQEDRRFPAGLCFYRMNDQALKSVLPYLPMLSGAKSGPRHTTVEKPRMLFDWYFGSMFNRLPRHCYILSRGNLHTATARAVARYLCENGYSEAVLCIDEKVYHGHVIWSMFKIFIELKSLNPNFQLHMIIEPMGPAEKDAQVMERIFRIKRHYLLMKAPFVTIGSLMDNTMAVRDIFNACRSFPGARMWICSTDRQAAELYDRAQQKGISIPGHIGLLTLENDPQYYHLGISSCTPDLEKVGYLMAHSLIGDFEPEKTTKGFIRISCSVIDKLTTRSAHRSPTHPKPKAQNPERETE